MGSTWSDATYSCNCYTWTSREGWHRHSNSRCWPSYACDYLSECMARKCSRKPWKHLLSNPALEISFGLELVCDISFVNWSKPQGCSLIALCGALTKGHAIPVSALVLYEIVKECGSPRKLAPSLEQWEALVRVAASVLMRQHLADCTIRHVFNQTWLAFNLSPVRFLEDATTNRPHHPCQYSKHISPRRLLLQLARGLGGFRAWPTSTGQRGEGR